MNRAIISQRITSILAEIERLNNALYAMNTTDIQRYPDNYEVLSTDAALRAERITCRLRHLIYATTSIKKEEYLRSAETMQGIEISENDGILEIKLPCLLPKRRQRQSTEFLLDPFITALPAIRTALLIFFPRCFFPSCLSAWFAMRTNNVLAGSFRFLFMYLVKSCVPVE